MAADLPTRGTGSRQADIDAYHNVNAVLRGRATHSQRRFEINGRSLESMSIRELKELAAYFAGQIRYANSDKIIRTIEG